TAPECCVPFGTRCIRLCNTRCIPQLAHTRQCEVLPELAAAIEDKFLVVRFGLQRHLVATGHISSPFGEVWLDYHAIVSYPSHPLFLRPGRGSRRTDPVGQLF